MEEKRFVIVMPGYNNAPWFEKSVLSAIGQKYSNFRIIYTDDASTDNTGNLVEEFIKKHNFSNIELIKNTNRIGALHNLYNMIHSCDDKEICVLLDGDDWLANSNVLNRLNREYQNPNIYMTYGSYLDYPGMSRGCCKPYEANVMQNNLYRNVPWRCSHLRTFYSKLFKQINKEDLMYEDKFFNSAWDLSFQLPHLELCGEGGFSYINDVLYIYNNQNPISDYKVRAQEQAMFDGVIRRKNKYTKLDKLF